MTRIVTLATSRYAAGQQAERGLPLCLWERQIRL